MQDGVLRESIPRHKRTKNESVHQAQGHIPEMVAAWMVSGMNKWMVWTERAGWLGGRRKKKDIIMTCCAGVREGKMLLTVLRASDLGHLCISANP